MCNTDRMEPYTPSVHNLPFSSYSEGPWRPPIEDGCGWKEPESLNNYMEQVSTYLYLSAKKSLQKSREYLYSGR